jgi:hypothetical protein
MRATKFQQKLSKDKETLWKIVKLFHPEIPNIARTNSGTVNVKNVRMEACLKYTWVSIKFRVRGYGYIDIGMQNSSNSSLWGKVTKEQMNNALTSGEVKFDIWRFTLDKVYQREEAYAKATRDRFSNQATVILKEAGYKLIELEEFYESYYSD